MSCQVDNAIFYGEMFVDERLRPEMSRRADNAIIYVEKLLTSDYEQRCLVERTTPMYYD